MKNLDRLKLVRKVIPDAIYFVNDILWSEPEMEPYLSGNLDNLSKAFYENQDFSFYVLEDKNSSISFYEKNRENSFLKISSVDLIKKVSLLRGFSANNVKTSEEKALSECFEKEISKLRFKTMYNLISQKFSLEKFYFLRKKGNIVYFKADVLLEEESFSTDEVSWSSATGVFHFSEKDHKHFLVKLYATDLNLPNSDFHILRRGQYTEITSFVMGPWIIKEYQKTKEYLFNKTFKAEFF